MRAPTFYVGSTVGVLNRDYSFRGPTAVKTQRPIQRDDEHVVVRFRPRTSAHPPSRRDEPAAANAQPLLKELQGLKGPEPTRYGDWENKGIASDF